MNGISTPKSAIPISPEPNIHTKTDFEIDPVKETITIFGYSVRVKSKKFWKYFTTGVVIAGIIAGIWWGMTGA